MKTSSILFGAIGICFFTATTLASPVADLVTFTANNTAKSAEVNQNFTKLKDANNDNDTRITTNAGNITTITSAVSTKQERVTDTCTVGQAIRAIAANGTVTCEVIAPVQTFSEYYAGSSFERVTNGSTTENNVRRHAYEAYAWADIAGMQYMNLPLRLPQGATITGLTCYVYDNDATNDISAMNQRIMANALGTVSNWTDAFNISAAATSGQSAAMISTVSPTGSLAVDNANFAYRIYIYSSTFGGSTSIRFYGCKVTYQK